VTTAVGPELPGPTPGAAYDLDARPDDQRHQALTYADTRQWLTFVRTTGERPSTRRYVIRLNTGTERQLRPEQVIAYVTAIADLLGHGPAFPEREDTPAT
jgi:hypothetical protein